MVADEHGREFHAVQIAAQDEAVRQPTPSPVPHAIGRPNAIVRIAFTPDERIFRRSQATFEWDLRERQFWRGHRRHSCWRFLGSDPPWSMQAIAQIGELFDVQRCAQSPDDGVRAPRAVGQGGRTQSA